MVDDPDSAGEAGDLGEDVAGERMVTPSSWARLCRRSRTSTTPTRRVRRRARREQSPGPSRHALASPRRCLLPRDQVSEPGVARRGKAQICDRGANSIGSVAGAAETRVAGFPRRSASDRPTASRRDTRRPPSVRLRRPNIRPRCLRCRSTPTMPSRASLMRVVLPAPLSPSARRSGPGSREDRHHLSTAMTSP